MDRGQLFTAALISLSFFTINGLTMRAINQVVTVREGEAVELACSADQDLKQCTFKNAKGEFRQGQAKGRFSYLTNIL